MTELTLETVEHYLSVLKGQPVRVLGLAPLGQDDEAKAIKFCGYGTPIRVDYQAAGQQTQRLVLHTMRPGPFGHEHMADRAQVLFWSNQAFGFLPRHVRSADVGGFRPDGTLISLGDVEEFFLLTEYEEGEGYFRDLEKLRYRHSPPARSGSRRRALRLSRGNSQEVWQSSRALHAAHS